MYNFDVLMVCDLTRLFFLLSFNRRSEKGFCIIDIFNASTVSFQKRKSFRDMFPLKNVFFQQGVIENCAALFLLSRDRLIEFRSSLGELKLRNE